MFAMTSGVGLGKNTQHLVLFCRGSKSCFIYPELSAARQFWLSSSGSGKRPKATWAGFRMVEVKVTCQSANLRQKTRLLTLIRSSRPLTRRKHQSQVFHFPRLTELISKTMIEKDSVLNAVLNYYVLPRLCVPQDTRSVPWEQR